MLDFVDYVDRLEAESVHQELTIMFSHMLRIGIKNLLMRNI